MIHISKNYSEDCIKLIKKWEGFQSKSYQDEINGKKDIWTIGYGTTSFDSNIVGVKITKGMSCTKKQAEDWLRKSITKNHLPKILKYDEEYDFSQGQIDALCSFSYNLGGDNIDKLLDKGKRSIKEIEEVIPKYCIFGGKPVQGLKDRRADELKLFKKVTKYTGKIPKLPDRGYFQKYDGYITLVKEREEVKHAQEMLHFAGFLKYTSDKDPDGKYGNITTAATKDCQTYFGLPVNGKFGKLCIGKIKGMRK